MSKSKLEGLREKLKELHVSLQAAGELDDETQAWLETVDGDIDAVLGADDEDGLTRVARSIRENLLRFEARHPAFSDVLGKLANTFSDIGI